MTADFRHCWAALSFRIDVFKKLWRDRTGVGAIEFAIIAPVLIMAYIGSFELSIGFNIARKVARASSTVADILARQEDEKVDKKTLDSMNDVAKSIMAPFEMTKYTLKITGIKVTGPGTGTVVWSRDEDGATPYQPGSTTTLPSGISSMNFFVVRSELTVPHELLLFAPGLADKTLKTIDISKTNYFRQRIGHEITCSDC